MMNRRSFLYTLAAAIAGATLDPERLLWIPGQKKIFDLGQKPAFEIPGWRILFPDGSEFRFEGVVSAFSSRKDIDDLLTAELVVKPTTPLNHTKSVAVSPTAVPILFVDGQKVELTNLEVEQGMYEISPTAEDTFLRYEPTRQMTMHVDFNSNHELNTMLMNKLKGF